MDGSGMRDDVLAVSAGELLQFVERIEAERADQAESKAREKEIWAELKGRGYMTRPVRAVIKERAEDPAKRAENEAVLELYRAALGLV